MTLEETQTTASPPIRVLVVDDEPRNLLSMEAMLGDLGLELIFASSGEDALKYLLRQEVAMVLLDVQMPGMDGFETAGLIRERERSRHTPILFVTAMGKEEIQVFRGYSVGAVDYLFKPLIPEILRAKVLVFAELYRKAHEVRRQGELLRELREREHQRELAKTRREADDAIRSRDAILQAIGCGAEELLRAADWRQSVQKVLKSLGESMDVSRIYIFRNHVSEDGELLTSQEYEWVASGVPSQIDDPALQAFPWRAGGFGRWEELLSRGQPLYSTVRELPPDERAFLFKQDILSFACVPILIGETWWGVIGFDDCSREREWSRAEVDALKTAADTLGAAIHRSQVNEQINRQMRRLAGLHAINTAISASLDLTVTLNVFLDQVSTQLAVDAAAVLLFNPHTHTLQYAAGRGFRTRSLQYTKLQLGEGYAGQAALEREVVIVPDLRRAQGPLRRSSLADEGFVSYFATPLISKGVVKGVLELLHRSHLQPAADWLDFVQTLAAQAVIAIDNAILLDDVQRSHLELSLAYDTTLEGWSRALDLRDKETEGHSLRVTEMAVGLGRAVGMSDEELVHVRRGALLHDIGKVGIPDSILHKAGPLDESEWKIMHLHPVYAYELLAPISYLRPAVDIPYCHHEKWDGSGYPRGLKGESIPLSARIFAVVDVWDALRSDRPYRKAWSVENTREHIRSLMGTHFDPKIVEAFWYGVREAADKARPVPTSPIPEAVAH
jgi:response regulator RpfG family c-di-GMP phosphodiesterase